MFGGICRGPFTRSVILKVQFLIRLNRIRETMEKTSRYTITLDDDAAIAKIIAKVTGISSLPFTTGAALLKRATSFHPVAAFVDVHLGLDDCGLDAIPELRKAWPHTPIIIITGDPGDQLIGQALAAGANDFIRKPISPAELTGRLHARIAELKTREDADIISFGDLTFCRSRSEIEKNGCISFLPKLEAQLLMALIENRGMLVPKDELKSRLWGKTKVSPNALDKKLSGIRKAFCEISSKVVLESIYGKGVILKN